MKLLKDYGSYVAVRINCATLPALLTTTDYIRLKLLGVTTLTAIYASKNKKKATGLRFYKSEVGRHQVSRFITTCPDHLQVDHINRDVFDNRQENLRCISARRNTMNRCSSSAFPGTHYHRATGKYEANLTVKGRREYLGLFTTQELAYNALKQAELQYNLNS